MRPFCTYISKRRSLFSFMNVEALKSLTYKTYITIESSIHVCYREETTEPIQAFSLETAVEWAISFFLPISSPSALHYMGHRDPIYQTRRCLGHHRQYTGLMYYPALRVKVNLKPCVNGTNIPGQSTHSPDSLM